MLEAGMDSLVASVFDVLDRRVEINALSALRVAIDPIHHAGTIDNTVIAFDANVFFRLNSHSKSEDIVDYFRSTFKGKLLLPGQVIQEFWNNQFRGLQTLASGIEDKFAKLEADVIKVDETFAGFSDRFADIMSEFKSDYGFIFDEATLRRTRSFVGMLSERALVPFAPREMFYDIAVGRKRCKTPPGFKDEGDGDFYVWVDLLLGLSKFKADGVNFDRAILVTHDKKIDWSREGAAHPILSAEVKTLCGATFETWPLDKLVRELAL